MDERTTRNQVIFAIFCSLRAPCIQIANSNLHSKIVCIINLYQYLTFAAVCD